jgi:hypothetical protein
VRAAGDALAVARQLAAAGYGPAIDLRLAPAPVLPADITRVAAEIADEEAEANARAHQREAARLRADVDAAEELRRAADAAVDARQAEQRRLLEGAAWCEERQSLVEHLHAEVVAAEAAEAEAQARLAAADARLAGVTEQRATAEGILGEARRQLAELEVAGSGENEVRRALEGAGQVARDADDAAASAAAEVERATAELAAAETRLLAASEAVTNLRKVAAGDPQAVAGALARLEASVPVPPSQIDFALADELERLAGLVDPNVVDVDPEVVTQAQQAFEQARATVEELRRPVQHTVPEWWDELSRLHAAVVDAEAGVTARLAGKGAHRRLEEAMAAEHAFLEQIGFNSHLDALMSGGRQPGQRRDPAAIAAANDALTQAEADLQTVRHHFAIAEEQRRIIAELEHLATEAAERLGRPDAGLHLDPDELRLPRPDPAVAADLASAMGVELAPEPVLADLARTWLAQHATATERLAAAEDEQAGATAEVADRRDALVAARAAVATAEAAARDARRQVEVVEAELGNRMGSVADPVTRAATAAALRDRIGALEARVSSAETEAAEERAGAAAAVAEATAAVAVAQRAVTDTVARMATLAQLVDEAPTRSGDVAADLAATAEHLRAAAEAVAQQIDAEAVGAAEASAAADAARVAHQRHVATPPGTVGDATLAEAVRRLLDPDRRTSDVIAEPLHAAAGSDEAQSALLEAVVAAGQCRPVLVVTDDPRVLGWAIELPAAVGGLVSREALQSAPVPADQPTAPAPAVARRAD